MAKQRLDKVLLERGLAETRTKAQAIIMAGQVLVDEQRIDKPGQLINPIANIRVKGDQSRYVSRGGLKLEAALTEFGVDPSGKTCIDIGASTGGFTDCLLQHGASVVWAVDVGRNQLAWRIRQDPRVSVIEGMNARYMEAAQFDTPFDLATIDVSFISLEKILPAATAIIRKGGDVIALVKPQFEVGKGEVGKGGIVRDPKKHHDVIERITAVARSIGFQVVGLIESPILGAEGNREFLLHLRQN
ncbi:MAG TPA: TlyA family RNA methyltransferase [Blastocatellia bacterium]|nr:TlyA family RNA methyltransferase [Blastocatellia bacterium]